MVQMDVGDDDGGQIVGANPELGEGAHHVGIYIGNGKMVSASNPRDGVEIIDYKGPWYGERYSGAGRVVG